MENNEAYFKLCTFLTSTILHPIPMLPGGALEGEESDSEDELCMSRKATLLALANENSTVAVIAKKARLSASESLISLLSIPSAVIDLSSPDTMTTELERNNKLQAPNVRLSVALVLNKQEMVYRVIAELDEIKEESLNQVKFKI